MNKLKTVFCKFTNKVNEYKTKIYLAVATASVSAVPAFANGNGEDTMKDITSKMLDVIYMMAKYIGILLATWGVVQLILAFKNEDADSKSRAMMLIVCAIALIAAKGIISSLGLLDM